MSGNPLSKYGHEFQEIGHAGGQITIRVRTGEDRRRGVQFGFRHTRPTAVSLFAIYALPGGIPVATLEIGGIGAPPSRPPVQSCVPVFIASDTLSMFGHQCPSCHGYWRSSAVPSRWPLTCSYCGFRAPTHEFLTKGQLRYVGAYCDMVDRALQSEPDGDHLVSMDDIADAVGKGADKPPFYYSEERQQNQFDCPACGATNDILGRYGYCSGCGTHNGLRELEADIVAIRARVDAGGPYETCVTDAVSAFDAFARQLAKQLAGRVAMTPRRRKEWERRLFHDLRRCSDDLSGCFDIHPLRNLSADEIEFAVRMFHRRHVYEHNGGEVDEKYVRDSGDTSVRVKQVIRENRETALRTLTVVARIGRNLQDGFHEVFPPEAMPVSMR